MLLFYSQSEGKQGNAPMNVSKTEAGFMADSLERVYGSNKQVPAKYRLAFYYALSRYPELISLRISIREKKLNSTMAARPTVISSLFRSKSKRRYVIYVNSDSSHASPQFHEFTFNAQIGVLGHELAHLLKYRVQKAGSLLGDAFRYKKENFKMKYERYTDSITVVRGLGWQCYDFATQLQNNTGVPEAYKKKKEKFYFSPREIYALMSDLGYEL